MKTNFIPSTRFTSAMFTASERFPRRSAGFFSRSYDPAGTVYTMNAGEFFKIAAPDVKTIADAEKLINVMNYNILNRFYLKLTDADTLGGLTVCLKVWDANSSEPDTLKGDAAGLLGVLGDLNRFCELRDVFNTIPARVTPAEWDKLLGNGKYINSYISDNRNYYTSANLRKISDCHAPAVLDDLIKYGCKVAKYVEIHKDYRDGLSCGDLREIITTPEGHEIFIPQAAGKKTFTIYCKIQAARLSKFWDDCAFDEYFKQVAPCGFSAGKLTEKKAREWFLYIDNRTKAAAAFVAERENAKNTAARALLRAGYEFLRDCDKGGSLYTKKRGRCHLHGYRARKR